MKFAENRNSTPRHPPGAVRSGTGERGGATPQLLAAWGGGSGSVAWLWAVYVMAYLVAGLPPFFGFNEFAWVALVGHLLFGWVAAAVIRWRLG